jgi:hypothetical protein
VTTADDYGQQQYNELALTCIHICRVLMNKAKTDGTQISKNETGKKL